MAAKLESISINAPGFFGLNTEDSPTGLSEQFALIADNCIIDQFGRIATRKGYKYVTPQQVNVRSLGEFVRPDGNTEIIQVTDQGVFTDEGTIEGALNDPDNVTTNLTNITPSGYNIGNGDYQHATLQQYHFLFREGAEPLFYDGVGFGTINGSQFANGTAPQAGLVVSAYGRLFAARTANEKTVLYWSDTLLGKHWQGGTSGQLDVATAWAGGADEITGIAAHNNFLVIFGRTQILLYSGANGDPNNDLRLEDTIVGIGCIAKDSIQDTGSDLLFLSDSGVRSLRRTIQEKSVPIGDISRNVRTDIIQTSLVTEVFDAAKSVYYPTEGFYLLVYTGLNIIYCFDTRQALQDGSFRTTQWNNMQPFSMLATREKRLLFGMDAGVSQYDGFTDNNEPYQFRYFTNYNEFQSPNNLKFLKNIKATFIGGATTNVVFNWAYDYSYNFKKRLFSLESQINANYNEDDYNEAEYTSGIQVTRPTITASGSGAVVQFGFEANINGFGISVQRITAQATIGRTI